VCGIVGVLDFANPVNPSQLSPAVERLLKRGPDYSGIQAFGAATLGHTRLSVLDVRTSSHQPFSSHDKSVHLVYNGEIYNYIELRRELQRLGYNFVTSGDTEVVMAAYQAWGDSCVKHFNGMFAFAIWDTSAQTLFLARDRLGEKPLYYAALAGGRFIFSSELAALRLLPGSPQRVCPKAVEQFLALNYLLGDTCIIEGVSKLSPAHTLTVRQGGVGTPRQYWDLASYFNHKTTFTDEEEAVEALSSRIDEAVKLRMLSDVPVGAFLSGGIDSAVVCASMASRGAVPQTFTIDLLERGFSEAQGARLSAAFIGSNHHEEKVDIDTAMALPKIIEDFGEPFADTSMIPTWHLSRFARRYVTVALSGDGADELFAGYETYRADIIRNATCFLPKAITGLSFKLIKSLTRSRFVNPNLNYQLMSFFRGHGLPQDNAHFSWRLIHDTIERTRMLKPEWRAHAEDDKLKQSISGLATQVKDAHYLDRAMFIDLKTWLVDDVLVKVDRASMAHSLEVRSPFLDHHLVEFAASLPVNLKMRRLKGKYLLRRAKANSIPNEILRGPKRGFGAPVSGWLRAGLSNLGREVTMEGKLREWIDVNEVDKLWREHQGEMHDHGYKLFGLICLGLWLRGNL
jgi:asparagine synthase (glutamine-hydrolysing)